MDILSHGLWAAVGAHAINRKSPAQKVRLGLAGFWGMFPDLFAFVPAIILTIAARFHGNSIALPRVGQIEPGMMALNPSLSLSLSLYNISHSLVIFVAVFCLVVLINKVWLTPRFGRRLIPWEMLGWLLHILCDIPTHTYLFFPTPVFWPLFGWEFKNGFSWGQPWFLALDYGLLLITALYFKIKKPAAEGKA